MKHFADDTSIFSFVININVSTEEINNDNFRIGISMGNAVQP